ncbi:hypothetical protein [Saccharopolyspora sp. NPDC002376]
MSTVHETTADLTAIIDHLERLVLEIRASGRWRIPEISAACDALACAAALLRTQQDGNLAHAPLLHDAIALARSTVEATKFAARERIGSHAPDSSDRF